MMSEILQGRDTYNVALEMTSVTDEEKRHAEEVGRQWAQETRGKPEAGIEAWRQLVDARVVTVCGQEKAELIGIAIAALDEGKVRDCILMHACEGTLGSFGDDMSPNYIDNTFLALEKRAPDVESIRTICQILHVCCEYASEKQGYPFAMMAYLLWWTAQYRYVDDYVCEALERDNVNSLAKLLRHIVNLQVVPPWLANQCGSLHIRALE